MKIQKIEAYKTTDDKIFDNIEDAEDHQYILELPANENQHLSKREQEVFNYLTKTSLENKEIAEKLGVTLTTIKAHSKKIYEKTNTKNRIELLINLQKELTY